MSAQQMYDILNVTEEQLPVRSSMMVYVLRSFKWSKQNEDHTNAFPHDSTGHLQKLPKLLKGVLKNSTWKL